MTTLKNEFDPQRDYLCTPGQQVKIKVFGDAGAGYTAMARKIAGALEDHGVNVRISEAGHHEVTLTARCLTPDEARRNYLNSLEPSQLQCLQGHLSALGFNLDDELERLKHRHHDDDHGAIDR